MHINTNESKTRIEAGALNKSGNDIILFCSLEASHSLKAEISNK